jgi:hypothetical protein
MTSRLAFILSARLNYLPTTGQGPVWHFAVDSSDNTGEPLLVEVKFNPQPLIVVIQSASPQLIDEQLKGAVGLLKQCSGVKGVYIMQMPLI